MILASFDFGVTWDEMDRHAYGIKVLEFLRGLRPRSSFAETGGHVYPGLFDTICAVAETWLPSWNRYELRHVINAVFGWIGIVYAGRLASRLFGSWAGVLASVLLALSPRYFAAAMNNPKDAPFAAMSVTALYYISTVSPRWPYFRAPTAIKIVVSLAVALNIRVGALLYVGYLCLLIAALVTLERCTDWRKLVRTGATLAAMVVAVLLLGTLFWPWAGAAPLTRPFAALRGAAGFPWNGPVLFQNYEYEAQHLPWEYAPWWFIISTPPVVLVGAMLSWLFVSDRADALRRVGLWAVVVVPLGTAIIMGATLYDGVRHLMFVRPIFAVIAAGGWIMMFRQVRAPRVRQAAGLLLAGGLASVAAFEVRFHPNQGVYFNELVGGPAGAFKRYEMDYWGNCIFQCARWASGVAHTMKATVVVSGFPGHVVMLDAERLPGLQFSTESQQRHHMLINMARGERRLFRELASEPALYRVRTPDGAVLCSVTPGPALGELGMRISADDSR